MNATFQHHLRLADIVPQKTKIFCYLPRIRPSEDLLVARFQFVLVQVSEIVFLRVGKEDPLDIGLHIKCIGHLLPFRIGHDDIDCLFLKTLRHLSQLGHVLWSQHLSLQNVLPFQDLLLVYRQRSPARVVQNQQHYRTDRTHTRREKYMFVSSVNIQQKLLNLPLLLMPENHPRPQICRHILTALINKPHVPVLVVLAFLQIPRILNQIFQLTHHNPHLMPPLTLIPLLVHYPLHLLLVSREGIRKLLG